MNKISFVMKMVGILTILDFDSSRSVSAVKINGVAETC